MQLKLRDLPSNAARTWAGNPTRVGNPHSCDFRDTVRQVTPFEKRKYAQMRRMNVLISIVSDSD
jgi:hypothetical protein